METNACKIQKQRLSPQQLLPPSICKSKNEFDVATQEHQRRDGMEDRIQSLMSCPVSGTGDSGQTIWAHTSVLEYVGARINATFETDNE